LLDVDVTESIDGPIVIEIIARRLTSGAASLWVGVLDGSLVTRLPIASSGVARLWHAA
jgi:hypothetical protein